MKLVDKIKDAVLKGLNEGFDIDDMGHDISALGVHKSGVSKHSKIHDSVVNFIQKGYSAAKPKKCLSMLTAEDIELLEYVCNNIDDLDDDTARLVIDNELPVIYRNVYIEGMKQRITSSLRNKRTLHGEELEFLKKYSRDIHDESHPLYRFYKVPDGKNLKWCLAHVPADANLNWMDTGKVYDMRKMFEMSKFNGDISLWDTSNVGDMSNMFCNSRFNGDISKWDVHNVTRMTSMFFQSDFNGDISDWHVGNVQEMSFMFMLSRFNGDISNWDVSDVAYMQYMFSRCPFNGDISAWDVSNVWNINHMFCDSSFDGDISDW